LGEIFHWNENVLQFDWNKLRKWLVGFKWLKEWFYCLLLSSKCSI
jgi:hypothetical protein